jgi:hypothetical protein
MEIKVIVPEITLATVVGDVVSYDEDGDALVEVGVETVGDKVAKIISKNVMQAPEYTDLKAKVSQIREEEIRAALKPIIEEALQAPIRKTNSWGDPTGQETTLRDIILDEAKRAWATDRNNSYSSNRETTDIRTAIREEVRKHINGEVAKAVKEAQNAALKAVGDLASAPVVDAVRKALGN